MVSTISEITVTEKQCFNFRDGSLDCRKRVAIIGILNVTPDSFYDGSRYSSISEAIEHACKLVEEGADIIDVGGESTRPGAQVVPPDEEIARVVPIIRELASNIDTPISIDTRKSVVAAKAIEAGASIVNDVSALSNDSEMGCLVAREKAGIILMHMQGVPETMQQRPTYTDVVAEVREYLAERIRCALSCGIERESIAIDPGIGFGKTYEHNLEIIRRLDAFNALGRPVLVGPSRKSFIGTILDQPVEKRLLGTASVVALAVANGARMVRVHDVGEMCQIVRMAEAIVRS